MMVRIYCKWRNNYTLNKSMEHKVPAICIRRKCRGVFHGDAHILTEDIIKMGYCSMFEEDKEKKHFAKSPNAKSEA